MFFKKRPFLIWLTTSVFLLSISMQGLYAADQNDFSPEVKAAAAAAVSAVGPARARSIVCHSLLGFLGDDSSQNNARTDSPFYRHPLQSQKAFSLVEMLVVIGTIGILAAMILPALSKAKEKARGIQCLGNQGQLARAWHLYSTDNNDFFPPNNSVLALDGRPVAAATSWCPDNPRFDTNTAGIQSGVIFPFVGDCAVYHCPSDRSTIGLPDGGRYAIARSYNASQSQNGNPLEGDQFGIIGRLPSDRKYIAVSDPSGRFITWDENPKTRIDSQVGYPPQGDSLFTQQLSWWDMPAGRHNQGDNLSFVDGHSARWRWAVPKEEATLGRAVSSPEERKDFERVGAAMKQPRDN